MFNGLNEEKYATEKWIREIKEYVQIILGDNTTDYVSMILSSNHDTSKQIEIKRPIEKTANSSDIRFSIIDPNESFNSFSDSYNCLFGDRITTKQTRKMQMTFSEVILEYMRKENLTAPQIYKAAEVDRKVFSRLISSNDEKPSRDTAIALGIGLKLPMNEFQDFLGTAGYTLSKSSRRDIIIGYHIENGKYRLSGINEVLDAMGEKTIG